MVYQTCKSSLPHPHSLANPHPLTLASSFNGSHNGMASSAKNRTANGMSTKIGSSDHDHNGAPIKGTHKDESIDNAGTNGTRVNGAATNGANGH